MNDFRSWKTDLLRSRIQAATQSKALRLPRIFCDISSIDSNGRRPKELEFGGHSFISDKDFMNFRRYALCGQDILNHPHSRGVRGAFRHIQHFNLHFLVSGS